MQLPQDVKGDIARLAGALPPSLGELGPLLTHLGLGDNAITSRRTELGALTGLSYPDLGGNAITSVPTELTALTGFEALGLYSNKLTGVPAEFRTVNPTGSYSTCRLENNDPGFSCANVGAGTSCCTSANCPAGTSTC